MSHDKHNLKAFKINLISKIQQFFTHRGNRNENDAQVKENCGARIRNNGEYEEVSVQWIPLFSRRLSTAVSHVTVRYISTDGGVISVPNSCPDFLVC